MILSKIASSLSWNIVCLAKKINIYTSRIKNERVRQQGRREQLWSERTNTNLIDSGGIINETASSIGRT